MSHSKKRKFAKLKTTSAQLDEYAQLNNRRPFVFGFVTDAGSSVWMEGSIPVGLTEEFLVVWELFCRLSKAESIADAERLDAAKKKKGVGK